MKYFADKIGDFSVMKEKLEEMEKNSAVKGIVLLLCVENNFDTKEFDSVLKKITKPIVGGMFAGLIIDGKKQEKGIIIVGLEIDIKYRLFEDLEKEEQKYDMEFREIDENLKKNSTIIVLFDGFSAGAERFKEEIFNNVGLEYNYIGGGAGGLSPERMECIISNKGATGDSGLMILLECMSGVGVAHGWDKISEPLKVTEAKKNKIISLDWEKAFDVYKDKIKSIHSEEIDRNNFFDIARLYPFGIEKMDSGMVVRDPIKMCDGNIICFGEVPENSYVYILSGSKDKLIKGAKNAKIEAVKSFEERNGIKPTDKSITLFIDCISRAMFLEDDYQKEIDIIKSNNFIGILTIGEIGNVGSSYLELYNKTSVVGILEV